ncbi:MAG: DUF6588 family protein [Bacteroidota bacterium]
MHFRSLCLVLALLAGTTSVHAQSLENNLGEVAESYARPYVQPFVNALGNNLNSGLFHPSTSGRKLFAPRFTAGILGYATLLPLDELQFNTAFQDTLQLEVEFEGERYDASVPAVFVVQDAPTTYGGGPGVVRIRIDDTVTLNRDGQPDATVAIDTTLAYESIAGLVNTELALAGVPYVEFGTVLGLDVLLRFVPELDVRDYGRASFRGAGARLNLRPYLPVLPFDVSVHAAVQSLDAEDNDGLFEMQAEMEAAGATASATGAFWRLYATLQWERTTVDWRYVYDPTDAVTQTVFLEEGIELPVDIEPTEITFRSEGFDQRRVEVGFAINVRPLTIRGGYTAGEWTALHLGVGLLVGGK